VPDGRYTVSFTATDLPGNRGTAVSEPVDVYAALAAVTRDTGLFYPQDGDALASRATVTFTLRSAATVTITVVDAQGRAVRTPITAKAYPKGTVTWQWNGKDDDGAFVPQGRYRIVVRATNGTQTAAQAVTVDAMAFRLAASVTTATPGKAFTITATSAESLKSVPVVTVHQPGLAAWTVTMTRVSANLWSATVRPKSGGTAGTLTLVVHAKDASGGYNQSVLRIATS
jgi:hypothetical protein